MILNLGCGRKPLGGPEVVNHDKEDHGPDVDVIWDLNEFPWPWPHGLVAEVYAIDVIEHLESPVLALEGIWQILMPNGLLHLRVPHARSDTALTDLTHKSHWMPKSLDYFVRGTEYERDYGFYSWMRWKVESFEYNEAEGNLYWTLRKDQEA